MLFCISASLHLHSTGLDIVFAEQKMEAISKIDIVSGSERCRIFSSSAFSEHLY